MLDINKCTKPNQNQQSIVWTAHVCVCVSLCTIVVQNTAQNSSDIFPLILQIITIAQMMRSGGEGATTTTTSIVTTFSCYVSVLLSSVTLSCVACPERPSFGITGATSTVSSITRSTSSLPDLRPDSWKKRRWQSWYLAVFEEITQL